jgi:hypothetical protein
MKTSVIQSKLKEIVGNEPNGYQKAVVALRKGALQLQEAMGKPFKVWFKPSEFCSEHHIRFHLKVVSEGKLDETLFSALVSSEGFPIVFRDHNYERQASCAGKVGACMAEMLNNPSLNLRLRGILILGR